MAAPGPPLNITVSQKVGSLDTLILKWDQRPGEVYYIYRDGVAIETAATGGSLEDTGLLADTDYSYVIAVNDNGTSAIPSAPVIGRITIQPFATVADLSAFWRPVLVGDETTRANALLELASNRLRSKATQYGFDMDEKAGTDSVYASNVKFVVLESVKRAMQTDQNVPPVDTYQQAAGPYSENYKFSNPSGDLWFKGSELAEIGLSGQQELGSISTTRTNIYGDQQEVA